MKYIPTETIAIYVAIQAALGDVAAEGDFTEANFTTRWIWFVIMLLATVVLAIGLSYRSQKNVNPDARFKVPTFETLAAGTAFAIWALSLPSTPLRDFDQFDYNAWSSVIILAGTIAISTAAYILGKTVVWQKVVDME